MFSIAAVRDPPFGLMAKFGSYTTPDFESGHESVKANARPGCRALTRQWEEGPRLFVGEAKNPNGPALSFHCVLERIRWTPAGSRAVQLGELRTSVATLSGLTFRSANLPLLSPRDVRVQPSTH
jgi:hypothetical protein